MTGLLRRQIVSHDAFFSFGMCCSMNSLRFTSSKYTIIDFGMYNICTSILTWFGLAQIKLWCFRKLINWFTFHNRRERQKYYKHQDKAKKMPHKYMSLITDGMDSSKTNIPHFKVKSKVSLFRHRLRRKAERFRLSGTRAIRTLKVPGRVILCFVV